MKLQIALDSFELSTAMEILAGVRELVDIAEVGTGLGVSAGAEAIRAIASRYPDLLVLSDMKIMDGGESLAGFAFDSGADIVSVLALADDATVAGAVRAARERGKEVLADMIGVTDVAERAGVLDGLGVDYLCVHTPYDLRASVLPPTEDLARVQSVARRAKAVVTGGISLQAIDTVVGFEPDVVVVGSAIMGAEDPVAAARAFSAAVHRG